MSNLRQAAEKALDALLYHTAIKHQQQMYFRDAAIEALLAALAEPEQHDTDCHAQGICQRSGYSITPTPRKPLTNEEISAILDDTLEGGSFFDVALAVARAIERHHGIGDSNG